MAPADPLDIESVAARLTFAVDGGPHTSSREVLFKAATLDAGLTHTRSATWPTDVPDVDSADLELACSHRNDEQSGGLASLGDALADISVGEGLVHVTVAARKPSALEDAIEEVRAAVPPRRPAKRGAGTSIWFWSEGEYTGAESEVRPLKLPSWRSVASNYSAKTRTLLVDLATSGPPDEAVGRAIIWHGEPGTGKTYALRALAREWRRWCDVHVVVDAERFLSNVGYMDDVLAHRSDGDRWRLIVLEDTGELLTADARERVGQGLSRLLNVTDGLFGEGTRALILVTTNEPVVRLHPAVSRPGRCLAEIEFEPLAPDDANDWLSERCEERVTRATSIAELYEIAAGRQRMRHRLDRITVGFAANGN